MNCKEIVSPGLLFTYHMHDIRVPLSLVGSEGASFTAKVMLPRLALLNKVREAVGRQLKRESAAQLAQQQAVRWQMQAEGPVLPPASKLGLNMLVQTMVLLLK